MLGMAWLYLTAWDGMHLPLVIEFNGMCSCKPNAKSSPERGSNFIIYKRNEFQEGEMEDKSLLVQIPSSVWLISQNNILYKYLTTLLSSSSPAPLPVITFYILCNISML